MSRLLLSLGGSLCPLISSRAFQVTPRRFAGHSKWQNIRHTKAAKDNQKSQLFTKMTRQMRVAIADGGGVTDPAKNSKLKSAIDLAKSYNMPKETIQKVLKSIEGQNLDGCKSAILEIRGTGGCYLLVHILTSNVNGAKTKLKSMYRKYFFQESTGALKTTFEHKGIVTAKPSTGNGSLETCLEHAIEAGAEDVIASDEEGIFEFMCDAGDVFMVQAQLSQLKYDILDASCKYQPISRVKLPEEAMEAVGELCEKMLNEPEVFDIVDNIE